MATQKQIAANRINALLSTGPRTEQGKAIARMNALKSGIDSRNETTGGEDPSALATLTAEYDREYQPIGLVERLLVDILIKDDWFLRRYRFLSADLVNHSAAVAYEQKRGADFGGGFAANTESFQRLHRHIIDTERSFFSHLAELERRQTLRRQHRAEVDPSLTDSPQTENPEFGFVSQPAPNPAGPPAPPDPAASPEVSHPPQTPKLPLGFVPDTAPPLSPQDCAPLPSSAQPVPSHPTRYTVISDSNSPTRPWQK